MKVNVKTIGPSTLASKLLVASFLYAGTVNAAVSEADAMKITSRYGCQACHAASTKLVGPAFKDIAKKYAGDKTAEERLEKKVKSGGSGVWGTVPMPPAVGASDADVATVVHWILSLT
jgi:cytochrome c